MSNIHHGSNTNESLVMGTSGAVTHTHTHTHTYKKGMHIGCVLCICMGRRDLYCELLETVGGRREGH